MVKLHNVKVAMAGLAIAGLAVLFINSSASAASASIALTDSSAALSQSSDTGWTLAKSGVVNRTNGTVTWTVSAAQGAIVAGQLVMYGEMTVSNYGTGPATIGNIVVNLQSRSGNQWITRSSDVANATQGDAATSAKIVALGQLREAIDVH